MSDLSKATGIDYNVAKQLVGTDNYNNVVAPLERGDLSGIEATLEKKGLEDLLGVTEGDEAYTLLTSGSATVAQEIAFFGGLISERLKSLPGGYSVDITSLISEWESLATVALSSTKASS